MSLTPFLLVKCNKVDLSRCLMTIDLVDLALLTNLYLVVLTFTGF